MSDEIRKFQYHGKDALALPAERDAFLTLKTWLSGIADELSLPDKIKKQLLISADEIFTNIASYGYPDKDGMAKVEVVCDLRTQILRMTFFDSGVPYNPLETPDPDVSKSLDSRKIGGLGIFMVKKLMDSVTYQREDQQNILILEKHLENDGVKK